MTIKHRTDAASYFFATALALFCWLSSYALEAAEPRRAIVLAWDGTVPAFVRELLRQGKLPHLSKLIEGGVFFDDVVSVFPSKTAPGFASLLTGAPPRLTDITGNRVPRAPREKFTILESVAGFSAAPLAAEPIWSAALRAGKKSVVSHIPAFAGELAEDTARFAGYTLIAGRDGIISRSTAQSSSTDGWRNLPASEAVPIEINFTIGESKFFALLIDDPLDDEVGYDTMILATARDGEAITARLKAAPAGMGGELFWSQPVAVTTGGSQPARCYLRLFDLKSDGSDFFLYHTRLTRDLPVETIGDVVPSPTVRTFVGNGASILYQQGAFGRTIPNGGHGSAEARYLETLSFAQHQLMETNRWAVENLPWDLYFAYTPFPDEAEHLWRGYLDSSLAAYKPEVAERLRPFLEKAYQSSDDHLGLLLSKRPQGVLFALISDHGMQGIDKRVAINPVLQQNGLLALDRQGRVDLANTRVLYPPHNNGYVLINSTDRKGGIVDKHERAEIIRRLRDIFLALRDGQRQVVTAVYDVATDGTALGIGGVVGGDLYLELAPGYDFDPRIAAGAVISGTAPYGNHGTNPEQAAMRTIMVFNGPGIDTRQNSDDVRIIDFAPSSPW